MHSLRIATGAEEAPTVRWKNGTRTGADFTLSGLRARLTRNTLWGDEPSEHNDFLPIHLHDVVCCSCDGERAARDGGAAVGRSREELGGAEVCGERRAVHDAVRIRDGSHGGEGRPR